jgi:transposase
MFDINDDTKGSYRRIELLTGPGRRRRWSYAEKARIVAESLAPGACVSAVARKWHVAPQQVFGWRRSLCRDGVVRPTTAPGFVPIVEDVKLSIPSATPASAASTSAVIEIRVAGAVVRASSGTDADHLTTVLRAVRRSKRRQ